MPSLGLGVSLGRGGFQEYVNPYTTFRTWDNDISLIGVTGFQLLNWVGTGATTLSFETAALDGVTDYAKLLVNITQTNNCMWRDNSVLDDDGLAINFADYTKYRVQAKLYCILDSSRTQITFSTSFGQTSQDRFQTTLQDQTWTNIDTSGTFSSGSGTHFYLWDFDQAGNFPIAGESFYLKDVSLSLG